MSVPDVASAGETAYRLLAARAVSIRRFPTGSCHWVFDVRLETGKFVVLRMTTASLRPAMHGALLMNELLRPKSVPLPRILQEGLNDQFPTLVLERLAGTDLAHIMHRLDDSMLEAIADRVVAAQEAVMALPSAGRYRYALEAATAPCASWPDFLSSSLERSRRRLSENGLFSVEYADRGIRRSGNTQIGSGPCLKRSGLWQTRLGQFPSCMTRQPRTSSSLPKADFPASSMSTTYAGVIRASHPR